MSRRKKKKNNNKIMILVLLVLILAIFFFFHTQKKLVVVEVVSRIDKYDYYLESNATQIYKDNYEKLKNELKKDTIDEEAYAKLISKLFTIDFYTLDNKVTNKDIGGVQFIDEELKERFTTESSNTVYKYVKNNLYNDRKQKLPSVSKVGIASIDKIKYKQDENAYKVTVSIEYKKDYNYPKEIKLTLIHKNNKLVIVEID